MLPRRFKDRRSPGYPSSSIATLNHSNGGATWRRGMYFALALLPLTLVGDIGAISMLDWRARFQAVESALQQRQSVDYSDLRAYPLYPYLRYRDLSGRLAEWPADEVHAFLHRYSDSPLADKLQAAWLRQLAAARRWRDYLNDVTLSHPPVFECWRRQALLETGQTELALRDFGALWLRGDSLPAACDPVITVWQAQGNPTPPLLWQRFSLAMTDGNIRLARFLRTALPATDQPLADIWLTCVDNPQSILHTERFSQEDARSAAIISEVLQRWGKRDPLAAAAALDTLKARYPTWADRWLEVERQLALLIATDYHPSALTRLTALPATVADTAVREWRVRVCLRQEDWPTTLHWLDQLSATEQERTRWQYWRGRALEQLNRVDEARRVYAKIASQRDYYGFLAANQLGKPYTIINIPLPESATQLEALIAKSPGLQRAQELFALGRDMEADAEWRLAIRSFDRPLLEQAASLASRWGWHTQAIATAARAEYWDDLALRFPLAYQEAVISNAQVNALNPAWIYAIIRQESSFNATARSPVGALGLMQLMPDTGQEIAWQSGEATKDPSPALLQPATNLRWGARYLQQILQRLQSNPLLATAAYNAGPNKVTQWLPAQAPIPADIWAETIPYQETRSYVQRVLEYAVIYTHRLGLPDSQLLLGTWMKPVLPAPAPEPRVGGPS